MGFWNTLGNIAKGFAEIVAEKAEEVNEKVAEFKNKSDERLMIFYVKGNAIEKIAAAKVLKSRGYNPEELKRALMQLAELRKSAEELERLANEIDRLANS
jgi:hypothetical protein